MIVKFTIVSYPSFSAKIEWDSNQNLESHSIFIETKMEFEGAHGGGSLSRSAFEAQRRKNPSLSVNKLGRGV